MKTRLIGSLEFVVVMAYITMAVYFILETR